MSKEIANVMKVIREAFEESPCFKRAYIDNVACALMDYDDAHLRLAFHIEKDRDTSAERIVDLMFAENTEQGAECAV